MAGRMKDLAQLERVDLKDIWEDEPGDFTPWLAKPANLKQLGATLGLELEDPETEVSVGGYYADIVATTAGDGHKVVVENQLARTDHRHLGQILTYAAGLDALTVVWIAKQFTEEHRAALEWLNNHTSENIGFFGLEIEVWRIGDSPCAPKFSIVAQPNDWKKRVLPDTNLSEVKKAQLAFWSEFRTYATEHATNISPTAPHPQNWMSMSIGRAGFRLRAIASTDTWVASAWTGKPEIRAEFVIRRAKQHFETLAHEREEINKELGGGLEWYSEPDVQQSTVYFRRSIDWRKLDARKECCAWLVAKLDQLHEVFQPRIKQLP